MALIGTTPIATPCGGVSLRLEVSTFVTEARLVLVDSAGVSHSQTVSMPVLDDGVADGNDTETGVFLWTGLPAGPVTFVAYDRSEGDNGATEFGPLNYPGLFTGYTVEACEVTTTTAAATTTTAAATTTTAAATTTTAAATPTTAAAATTIPAVTTTIAIDPPSTAAAPTTAVVQTTAAASANTLPATGGETAPLIGGGLGFLLVGVLALASTRRRRPAHQR